jgi:hypothetical protein
MDSQSASDRYPIVSPMFINAIQAHEMQDFVQLTLILPKLTRVRTFSNSSHLVELRPSLGTSSPLQDRMKTSTWWSYVYHHEALVGVLDNWDKPSGSSYYLLFSESTSTFFFKLNFSNLLVVALSLEAIELLVASYPQTCSSYSSSRRRG